jgi:hypothetical protein
MAALDHGDDDQQDDLSDWYQPLVSGIFVTTYPYAYQLKMNEAERQNTACAN